MHGRVKVRTTAEEQERKRKEKAKKSQLYRKGIDRLFEKRKACELDDEILALSAQLLTANPDITTAWNIRREALEYLMNEEDKQQRLTDELRVTEQCLRANPKSYGSWHHRCWVLTHMPAPRWDQELALCNKYLDLDERNFHVWNYRRFVVEQSQVPPAGEFEYTTKKILVNFSNYSSWHYRSKLLPLIYPSPNSSLPIQEEKHKEELELVHNAAFTDPNDQSAWFYQRWLFGRVRQPLMIAAVCILPDKAYITLTQSVKLLKMASEEGITLFLKEGDNILKTPWRSSSGDDCSTAWICTLVPTDVAVTDVLLFKDGHLIHSLKVDKMSGEAGIIPQFSPGLSEGVTSVLENELESCLQLLELEPDSKWTLLTTVLLMQAISRQKYESETFHMLEQLRLVDPQRSGYYSDLRSQYKMQYALEQHNMSDQKIDLSHLGLTTVYHSQYLLNVHTVDLSHNSLKGRSLSQLHPLLCCQVLNLDDNEIETLTEFPFLISLRTLSLQNNRLSRPQDMKELKACYNIMDLKLGGNLADEDTLLRAFHN